VTRLGLAFGSPFPSPAPPSASLVFFFFYSSSSFILALACLALLYLVSHLILFPPALALIPHPLPFSSSINYRRNSFNVHVSLHIPSLACGKMVPDGNPESYQAHHSARSSSGSSSREDPWPLPTPTPASSGVLSSKTSLPRRPSVPATYNDLPHTDVLQSAVSRSASVSSPHHPRGRKGSLVAPARAYHEPLEPIADDTADDTAGHRRHREPPSNANQNLNVPTTRTNLEPPDDGDDIRNDQPRQLPPRRESLRGGHLHYWVRPRLHARCRAALPDLPECPWRE
jgi:hypothetical protein